MNWIDIIIKNQYDKQRFAWYQVSQIILLEETLRVIHLFLVLLICLYRYSACNLQFTVYYDKVFKKEYLPSRIRYNQFFFYLALGYWIYHMNSNVSRGIQYEIHIVLDDGWWEADWPWPKKVLHYQPCLLKLCGSHARSKQNEGTCC